jgi:ferrochelatase
MTGPAGRDHGSAVLLLAFGGPERADEVRPFVARVLAGRRVGPGRIDEVAQNYEAIGGRSPLPEWTRRQAGTLEARLAARGAAMPVAIGYRFSAPTIEEALAALHSRGIERAIGVIMAAHDGPAARDRYREAAETARAALGAGAPVIAYAAGFHAHPGFVAANAEHVHAAAAKVPAGEDAALVFTAHSVPVEASTPYAEQIAESARLVATTLGRTQYRVAYQSRSGAPESAWLEPSIEQVIDEEAARGRKHVVVCPIGFVCDHVEVVYDLDRKAAEHARARGVTLHRAATAGTHPAFIDALADSAIAVAR